MVGIAQSVERLVVVQKVAGSSPVTHPVEIGMNFKKVHADLFVSMLHALALLNELFNDSWRGMNADHP